MTAPLRMRCSVWIFLASIFLPSLGLAWLAVRSAQDQQVVLEHQQVIISQNLTDALAQDIQSRMDQVRDDFVATVQQLRATAASPQDLAEDFNRRLRDAWPLAGIGFAVNLDEGEIYSPKSYEGPEARAFRDENGRFLSNRENAEVYSSNALQVAQNFRPVGKLTNAVLKQEQEGAAAAFDLNNTAAVPAAPARRADKGEAVAGSTTVFAQIKSATRQPAPPAARSQGHSAVVLPSGAAASGASTDFSAAATKDTAPVATVLSLSTNAAPIAAAAAAPAAQPPVSGDVIAPEPAPEGRASDNLRRGALADKDEPALAGNAPANSAAPAAGGAGQQAQLEEATPASPSFAQPMGGIAATASPATVAPLPPAVTTNVPAPTIPTTTASASEPAPVAAPAPPAILDTLQAPSAAFYSKVPRQVIPQRMLAPGTATLSNTVPEESDFRRVIGTQASGSLARFLEDKLRLLVWSHPAGTPIVFGAQLDPARLVDALKAAFQLPALQADSLATRGGYCLAILDDTGHPVALSRPGFVADWKHPFVATEIGEALPHWEAALYLTDPQSIGRAARTLQATLGLIVLVLVAAIVSGGSLVAADVRRQMRLAQQKTDFVSNVSHELKTPLTSIRMFADLLAEKRVPDEARQSAYLRIIAAEAARLTRLINNVLDFARLERGAPPGEHRDGDLVDAVRDVVETCAPHLETGEIALRCEVEAEPLPIHGDRDALAQIILNLLSNAEKYGGSDILVRVRRQETPGGALGCVDVLDRGPGIPAAAVKTIFEPFQRLDDSLASGIPGTGLGLTLARRMARAHGGDVTYTPRAGGGSCFTLAVPLRPA
ncbi:MAG: HAMP domain-containing sensor histidine kinase [Verrucomicrobiota bacterium]